MKIKNLKKTRNYSLMSKYVGADDKFNNNIKR